MKMKIKKQLYGSGPFTTAETKKGYKKVEPKLSGEYPEWTRQVFDESGQESDSLTQADYEWPKGDS